MLETTMRRVARAGLPLLMITLGEVLGPAATPLAAQAPGEEQEPASVEGEEPIEWNFRPEPAASAVTDASLQERWAAPFAVISQGRPAPRAPREVVVLRDSVAARRVAVAQAATGQSVAEVTLEEDGAASAPAAEEAVEPATEAGDGRIPTADAEDEDRDDGASSADSPADPEVETEDSPPPTPRPAAPGASSAGGARTHRVAYGETWYGLAREYRISSRDLAAANPEVDPERLRAGTVLRIPAAGSADAAPRRHTVIRGDTLFGIARRYGVSAAAIRSANRLQDDVVRLGQTLVIPREEASR